MKKKNIVLKTASLLAALLLSISIFTGCSAQAGTEAKSAVAVTETADTQTEAASQAQTAQVTKQAAPAVTEINTTETNTTETQATEMPEVGTLGAVVGDNYVYNGNSYRIIAIDGGDMSGSRQASVAVDIGYGDRAYWGMTNEYGQLIAVVAENITLQDDASEPVGSNGRYYRDEADVPGTELSNYDKGHVIADSLGGVSNAYNITPQDSTLNRHGDQAYMEKVIRDAGGCQNFIATITYPDTSTQTPSSYKFQYTVKGNTVTDEFPNQSPEGSKNSSTASSNAAGATSSAGTASPASESSNSTGVAAGLTDEQKAELARIDANGNGQVTIAEAKKAGIPMPVTSDNWLYQYMDDRDGDGSVGE